MDLTRLSIQINKPVVFANKMPKGHIAHLKNQSINTFAQKMIMP